MIKVRPTQDDIFATVYKAGLEAIVSKKVAPYRSGASKRWIKASSGADLASRGRASG